MIGDENKFDGEKIRLDLVEPSLIEAIGKIRTYGVKKYTDEQSWNHIAILDTKTGRISVEQDLYAIETAEKFKQKKGFCKDGRFNGREVVIAWMPLPEAPKEET